MSNHRRDKIEEVVPRELPPAMTDVLRLYIGRQSSFTDSGERREAYQGLYDLLQRSPGRTYNQEVLQTVLNLRDGRNVEPPKLLMLLTSTKDLF